MPVVSRRNPKPLQFPRLAHTRTLLLAEYAPADRGTCLIVRGRPKSRFVGSRSWVSHVGTVLLATEHDNADAKSFDPKVQNLERAPCSSAVWFYI